MSANKNAFGESVTKFIDSVQKAQRMTHAAVVVTAASILDNELERCIKTKMRPLDKAMAKRLFENYGPLSSFAAKIDIAYAFGITTPDINDELNKVRRIRNAFAHTTQLLSLDREPIRPLFDALKRPSGTQGDYAEVFMNCIGAINDFLERYLFHVGITEDIAERNKVPNAKPECLKP